MASQNGQDPRDQGIQLLWKVRFKHYICHILVRAKIHKE